MKIEKICAIGGVLALILIASAFAHTGLYETCVDEIIKIQNTNELSSELTQFWQAFHSCHEAQGNRKTLGEICSQEISAIMADIWDGVAEKFSSPIELNVSWPKFAEWLQKNPLQLSAEEQNKLYLQIQISLDYILENLTYQNGCQRNDLPDLLADFLKRDYVL